MKSTHLRTMYSPYFASIRFSFYRTNLALSFSPWPGKEHIGSGQYMPKKYLNTTISDENAAALYLLAKNIAEGTQVNPIQYVIECNNQTMLTFEHDSDQTFFTIEKGNEKIVFQFVTHQFKEKENGKIVTKTIQSGLLFFSEILQAYLTAIAEDRQQDSQPYAGGNGSKVQKHSSGWR